MNRVEEWIVILGISLDIFAAMECQGSLVARVEKKRLLVFCGILAAGQALALGMGEMVSLLLCRNRTEAHEVFLGQVMAAVIFLYLGLRLLLEAWRNERILERREEKFDVLEFVKRCGRTIVFTFLAGVAFGFLGSSMPRVLLKIIVLTVLVTVLGMYTGYRLGYEHKSKAYLAGGILLLAGGADVIARHICKLF